MDYEFDDEGIVICPDCGGSGVDNGYVAESAIIHAYKEGLKIFNNDEDKAGDYANENYENYVDDVLMYLKYCTCERCGGAGELDWISLATGYN